MFRRAVLATAVLFLPALPAVAADARQDARLARGKYLMDSIVACGNCHIARDKGVPQLDKGLSGGMVFDEPPFKAFAPNITPDPATGIGTWTDAQLARAIREGIRPDGSVIGPPMPIELYRGIADADLAALVAYLRAQPPIRNAVPKSEYRIKLPPNYGPPVTKVTAPAKSDTVKYGRYLVTIGHCMECHTPMDAQGLITSKLGSGGRLFKGPFGESLSRNLTPHESGLKGWTDAQIARAIREGVSRDGSRLKPPMAFDWYKNIDGADMKALIAYLRTLTPQPVSFPVK
jgi:mono/diheme cytochrome c family protein